MPKRATKKTIRVKSAETASVAHSTRAQGARSGSTTDQIAVIETGGKQYVVKMGQEIVVEKLEAKEKSSVEFKDLLHGKTVKCQVLEHSRTPKLLVIKFKPKVRYLRRHGHRQWQTRLKVERIA